MTISTMTFSTTTLSINDAQNKIQLKHIYHNITQHDVTNRKLRKMTLSIMTLGMKVKITMLHISNSLYN